MPLLTIALLNLLHRPVRSLLTLLGVAIAVGSQFALLAVADGVGAAWESSLVERDAHIVGLQPGAFNPAASALPDNLGPALSAVPEVAHAAGALVNLVPVADDRTMMLSAWEDDDSQWRNVELLAGRLPTAGANEVVAGRAVAPGLGGLGAEIEVLYRPLEVVGIVRSASVVNDSALLTTLSTMQRMTSRPGQVSLYMIVLRHPGDPGALAAALAGLRAAAPTVEFSETGAFARDNLTAQLLGAIANASSAIAVVMGALVVANMLGMAVAERGREISILRAVGWARGRILAMILSEGMALTLIGGIVGFALGVAGARAALSVPVVGAMVEPEFSGPLFAQVIAVTCLMGLFGAAVPAWTATRVNPASQLAG